MKSYSLLLVGESGGGDDSIGKVAILNIIVIFRNLMPNGNGN